MTHEEAINIVKTQYPHDSVMKEALGTLIPELRESEDERIRQYLIEWVSISDNPRKKECLSWLEKQKEQKPAEWSEEDENVLKYLHDLISWGYAEKFMDAQTAHDMRVWINERLRHDTFQNGNSRPKSSDNWKPSEEHLSALLAVFNDPDNIGSQTCQLALTDLYEQLKKL